MDLKCLSYLVAVIECGSFARASARLHIAQPALGWQIRKLETELNIQLLTRHSRGVEPTEAGRRLFDHARAILGRVQQAEVELKNFAEEAQGTVILGMTPSVNSLLTLQLLKRLSVEAPHVCVRPVEELSAVVSEWVVNGRLDLGIGFPVTKLEGLSYEPLIGEAHYFVEATRPGAPTGTTISFAEAARHELVMTVMSHRYRAFLEETAKSQGVKINIVHQMQSVATLRDLVIQGVASAILPFGVVAREVMAGTLIARRVVKPEINREIDLFRAERRPATKAEEVVCTMIRRIVAETMIASPRFWLPLQRGTRALASFAQKRPPDDSRPAVKPVRSLLPCDTQNPDADLRTSHGSLPGRHAFDDFLRV